MLEHLGQVLPAAIANFGDQTALITDTATLSFSELDQRSNQLANALTRLGVTPGDRVTLYSPNCWQWVVSYYGVLKAGAVINPINVMLTPEEVEYTVRDCDSSVILGSREKLEPLCGIEARTRVRELLCFGEEALPGATDFQSLLQAESEMFTPLDVDADTLSTICYTSGTTGHPKGAMHSHRNVLLNAQMTALMHGRTRDDTVVTALPCSHVYGNVVMNAAMLTGMTMVMHGVFKEDSILQSIQNHRATLFEGVPTMYMYLLNYPDLEHYDVSSLRACMVGGQTMPVAKIKEVEQRFDCPLIELWGMTELAGLGTTFAHTGPRQHGSVGVCLPHVQARIADPDDAHSTLAADEIGELMIKGPIVMMGYYGNEQGTRDTIEEDGWLHTGDVGKIDSAGNIYIVDRKKDMIITAGFNIYPAEIERVISGHPSVAMVAVGSVPDEVKGELAKAYIIPKSGTSPSADSIVEYCRAQLAAYKVPRAVQFVDDFPKTSSGKIMRHKLNELDSLAG